MDRNPLVTAGDGADGRVPPAGPGPARRPSGGARRWLRRARFLKPAAKSAVVAGAAIGAKRLVTGRTPAREVDRPRPLPNERSASVRIALLFLLATAAGIGLLIVYARGGQVQLEGLLLAVAAGSIGFGFILWGKHLFPHEIVTEEREPHASDPRTLKATDELIEESQQAVTRRNLLVRLLLGALGALAVAFVFPLRSLGPNPRRTLFTTEWRAGTRVVDEKGKPIAADTLQRENVITVFPEGHTGAAESVAILVNVDPSLLQLPPGREGWAPQGNVCYSKICTHAGCPVGLYLSSSHRLQCPCHQSAFDVTNGAQVVFGPAPRALPQLELTVDDEGNLRAAGDFSGPVGPGFWNRGDQP
jgi:ubiquinol-cytochrome c reductase iron-sulfur subunit